MPKKEEKLKMKKIILTAMLLFLTGCGIYGQGKTYGYVTTIEDGIFLDKVWIRAELESSQTDCYIIDDNYLKNQLFQMAEQKQRLEITFDRHFFALTDCDNTDEVKGFRIIEDKEILIN